MSLLLVLQGASPIADVSTGVPAIVCDPLILNLRIDPLELDIFTQPLRSFGTDPFSLNIRTDPLELDVAVQPLRIRCDD